jgi:hypothetical protein
LEKAPAVAVAAGVGIAAGKTAMASPPGDNDPTKRLLEAVINGQAKINGRLYAANELLMDVLRDVIQHAPGLNVAAAKAKLDEAEGYIDAVPLEDPPGCKLPNGYGGY